jgi:hypothetical protein
MALGDSPFQRRTSHYYLALAFAFFFVFSRASYFVWLSVLPDESELLLFVTRSCAADDEDAEEDDEEPRWDAEY